MRPRREHGEFYGRKLLAVYGRKRKCRPAPRSKAASGLYGIGGEATPDPTTEAFPAGLGGRARGVHNSRAVKLPDCYKASP